MHSRIGYVLAAATFFCAEASAQSNGFAFLLETGATELLQGELGAGTTWSIGPLPAGRSPLELAWNDAADRILALSQASGELYEIEPWSGIAIPRAALGNGPWNGLGFAPSQAAYFALRGSTELVQIDATSFVASSLGNFGTAPLHSLAIHPAGLLYALRDQPPALVRLDPARRTALVQTALLAPCHALAIDPVDGSFLTAIAGSDALHRIDPASGATSALVALRGLSRAVSSFAVPPCRGVISQHGSGCDGGAGMPLRIHPRGLPCLTHRMSVLLQNALPGPIYYVRGHDPSHWGPLPLPFDLSLLGAPGCFVLNPHDILVGPLAHGIFHTQLVPLRLEFIGALLAWQSYSFAPGVPNVLGIASSDSVRIVLAR
ncbi:MAG: hypothetical protein JNM84_15005 [Planctomycetes bacterium]|nr:hypothetical protein [Planctomycetota bacterium]